MRERELDEWTMEARLFELGVPARASEAPPAATWIESATGTATAK